MHFQGCHFYPEDESTVFFRNVDNYLPDYEVSEAERPQCD
jgi:hypothetical protein